MTARLMSRRQIPVGLAASLGAAALTAGGAPAAAAETGKEPGLVHTADAIHQSLPFAAPRQRVYAVLTSADQFQKVVELGEAFKTMPAGKPKAVISPEVGGAFSLFGGYIVGRHLDLKPGERLVQAWREVIWDPGQFSLVSFQLAGRAGGTALTFDHTGFPEGAGPHLSIPAGTGEGPIGGRWGSIWRGAALARQEVPNASAGLAGKESPDGARRRVPEGSSAEATSPPAPGIGCESKPWPGEPVQLFWPQPVAAAIEPEAPRADR